MSFWKQILVLCLLAALAYGGYETYQRHFSVAQTQAGPPRGGPRKAIVEVVPARRMTLSRTVEAVGTTRARQSVDIVPEAEGRVMQVDITSGAHVRAGTVLVRLDDTIERANMDESQARLREREKVFERMTRLRSSNAVAEAALEDAVARLAEARAELERARQHLAQRSIRAPFSGVLGMTEIYAGARVTAGAVITRLDDLSEVVVEFSLPETLFAQVRRGQPLQATSVAFPDRHFTGRIEAVDSRIDPVSRSFRTRAIIPNPDGTLPAGMFMSLELTLSETQHVVVPEEAIIFQAAETYVFAVRDGVAHRTRVRTGQRQDGKVAVLDGLDEGQTVVVRGLHRVRDKGAVEIRDPSQTALAVDGADT
ncbi:efflux RND transporter periplasmic adaptor subunit [Rhodobacteraceae bacterium F11138]|nr:efflux RND transporter periplasmic adaptor subunit [Rhodobacteraceae bacterium F11138]